jgi:hypothetical protein
MPSLSYREGYSYSYMLRTWECSSYKSTIALQRWEPN